MNPFSYLFFLHCALLMYHIESQINTLKLVVVIWQIVKKINSSSGTFSQAANVKLILPLSVTGMHAAQKYPNSSSISALTFWAQTACLKLRILSGKSSNRNQELHETSDLEIFFFCPLHIIAELYSLAGFFFPLSSSISKIGERVWIF